MLSYLLLGTGLIVTYFAYCFFENREKAFIKAFISPYGPFIDEVNLNLLSIEGKDKLRWGSKLYLFNEGMIIGEPQRGADNIYISLKDIKGLTQRGKDLIFYHKINGTNLPVKFEISGLKSKILNEVTKRC